MILFTVFNFMESLDVSNIVVLGLPRCRLILTGIFRILVFFGIVGSFHGVLYIDFGIIL